MSKGCSLPNTVDIEGLGCSSLSLEFDLLIEMSSRLEDLRESCKLFMRNFQGKIFRNLPR